MADTKLSDLTELAAGPAETDELYLRDVSEATSAESKRITAVEALNPENFTELAAAPASTDEVFINDGGVGKKITVANLQKLVANLDLNGFNIAFPATQVANAGANVLDDYEEGTWTPTIQDDSRSDSENVSYSVQVGRYTKIGQVVYIQGYVRTTDVGDLTGSEGAVIGGLPFPSANISNLFASVVGTQAGLLNITAGYNVGGDIASNVSVITLNIWDAADGTTALTVTEWSADGLLIFSGFYRV